MKRTLNLESDDQRITAVIEAPALLHFISRLTLVAIRIAVIPNKKDQMQHRPPSDRPGHTGPHSTGSEYEEHYLNAWPRESRSECGGRLAVVLPVIRPLLFVFQGLAAGLWFIQISHLLIRCPAFAAPGVPRSNVGWPGDMTHL